MSEINKIILNGVEYDIGSSGSGLTEPIKQTILGCFQNVAWIDDDGQDYYDTLYDALYPQQNLVRLSCVYTPSGIVYTTDSLDSLKNDLVVTAHWNDSTTSVIANYTLSGTLVAGTNTITVSYGGKTTTFTVTTVEKTTSPLVEYDHSELASRGAINSGIGNKAVTIEYEVDEVVSSARNIIVALFYPWNNYGGSNWQQLPHACYLNGQSAESANGEYYSTRSTYGLDSEGNLPSTIATSNIVLKANTERVRFTIPVVYEPTTEYQANAKEYCYAYIQQSGYIFFAGSETPYYGKEYITD